MAKLDLSYPAFVGSFGRHNVKNRLESTAMLAWFLDNYYHLEPTEVSDAICDKSQDKGVDGIYVSDLLEQVDIFSAVIGTATPVQDLGDADLREFLGTVSSWFKNGDSVRALEAPESTANAKLKQLLDRLEVAKALDNGYTVRAVFVTNKKRNPEAQAILDQNRDYLVLYDAIELERDYLQVDKASPIATPISFDVSETGALFFDSGTTMAIAPVQASQLVLMEGIANQELFAWNVRYRLKRSPINKAIDKSVQKASEHKFFPAFHNGLTILCETLTPSDDKKKITIAGYAVVNGCQSLSSLFDNSGKLTPELRIVTRFIKVEPTSELALKITDYTNRQNGITGRDRQSNNLIHTRLQTDMHTKYPDEVYYRIARGEHTEWNSAKVIENEDIARVLLAFDLKQPESCHQTYRLFEELHSDIFGRKEVDADRLVALNDLNKVIEAELPNMSHAEFADYTQARFLLHYLVREVLDTDELGKQFVKEPAKFLHEADGRERFIKAIQPVVVALISITDADLKRRDDEGEEYDFKKELKSKTRIGEMRSRIVAGYDMAKRAGMTKTFADLWPQKAE